MHYCPRRVLASRGGIIVVLAYAYNIPETKVGPQVVSVGVINFLYGDWSMMTQDRRWLGDDDKPKRDYMHKWQQVIRRRLQALIAVGLLQFPSSSIDFTRSRSRNLRNWYDQKQEFLLLVCCEQLSFARRIDRLNPKSRFVRHKLHFTQGVWKTQATTKV